MRVFKSIIVKSMLVSALGLPTAVSAKGGAPDSWGPTEAELGTLPEFCVARFKYQSAGIDHPDVDRWSAAIGDHWVHIHHHCAAINFLNRADKQINDKKARAFQLQRARGEFEYMLSHTDETFILLPDVYMYLGKVALKEGEEIKAVNMFRKAISTKPDYTKPYIALSNYYRKSGNKAKAREVLEEALTHAPNSKVLQRRLKKLEQ